MKKNYKIFSFTLWFPQKATVNYCGHSRKCATFCSHVCYDFAKPFDRSNDKVSELQFFKLNPRSSKKRRRTCYSPHSMAMTKVGGIY